MSTPQSRYRERNREKLREKSRRRYREEHDRLVLINRRSSYRIKYGITLEQYEVMLAAQNGACFLCQQPVGHRNLHVDHSHETGEVRKLLCNECNIGLGKFRENPEVLRAAASYLESYIERLRRVA